MESEELMAALRRAEESGARDSAAYRCAQLTLTGPRFTEADRKAAARRLHEAVELLGRCQELRRFFEEKGRELARQGVDHPQIERIFRLAKPSLEDRVVESGRLRVVERYLTELRSRLEHYLGQLNDLNDRVHRMREALTGALAQHPGDGTLQYFHDRLNRFEAQLRSGQLPERELLTGIERDLQAYLEQLTPPAQRELSLPEKMTNDLMERFGDVMTVAESRQFERLLADISSDTGHSLGSRLQLWALVHKRQAELRTRLELPELRRADLPEGLAEECALRGWSLMERLLTESPGKDGDPLQLRKRLHEALCAKDVDRELRKLEVALDVLPGSTPKQGRKAGKKRRGKT